MAQWDTVHHPPSITLHPIILAPMCHYFYNRLQADYSSQGTPRLHPAATLSFPHNRMGLCGRAACWKLQGYPCRKTCVWREWPGHSAREQAQQRQCVPWSWLESFTFYAYCCTCRKQLLKLAVPLTEGLMCKQLRVRFKQSCHFQLLFIYNLLTAGLYAVKKFNNRLWRTVSPLVQAVSLYLIEVDL